MKVIYSLIGYLLFLISGCTFTPYNTHFECPLEKGVACTRLSKINRMVDRGELGIEEEDVPHGSRCKGSCSVKSLSREIPITYFYKKEEPILQQHLEEPKTPVEEIKESNPSEDGRERTKEEKRDLVLGNHLLAPEQSLDHRIDALQEEDEVNE